MQKKKYTKPVVRKILLDNSISLIMMTRPPKPPKPRGGGGASEPFQSPFGDKPFG